MSNLSMSNFMEMDAFSPVDPCQVVEARPVGPTSLTVTAQPRATSARVLDISQRVAGAIGGTFGATFVPANREIAAAQGLTATAVGAAVTNLGPGIAANAAVTAAGQTAAAWGLPAAAGKITAVAGMGIFGAPTLPAYVPIAASVIAGITATAALNGMYYGYQAYTAK